MYCIILMSHNVLTSPKCEKNRNISITVPKKTLNYIQWVSFVHNSSYFSKDASSVA